MGWHPFTFQAFKFCEQFLLGHLISFDGGPWLTRLSFKIRNSERIDKETSVFDVNY